MTVWTLVRFTTPVTIFVERLLSSNVRKETKISIRRHSLQGNRSRDRVVTTTEDSLRNFKHLRVEGGWWGPRTSFHNFSVTSCLLEFSLRWKNIRMYFLL